MVRFDHVGISVPDLDAAITWYRETLNLAAGPVFAVPGTDLRGAMLLHASGWRVELLHRPGALPGLPTGSASEAAGTLGYGHMCLRVDSPEEVDAQFRRLVAAGAAVRMRPQAAPRAGARMAFVADPYGNLIELIDRH